MAEETYVIRQVTINAVSTTDIDPPIPCNKILMKNSDGTDFLVYSDKNNALSGETVSGASQKQVGGDAFVGGSKRFHPGKPPVSVKATTGVGPLIVEYSV
jgi:hypothetical protein